MSIVSAEMRALPLLDALLRAEGVPLDGVEIAHGEYVARYLPEATAQQIAAGDAIIAAFDVQAALSDLAELQQLVDADRRAVVNGANQILADAEAGIAACLQDLATVAAGLEAVANMSTITQQRQILAGMLGVLDRIVKRQGQHIQATATLTRYLRNEAAK